MENTDKWAAYDVARSRLLTKISEYDHLIDLELSAPVPNAAKIAALEIDQSDILGPEPHFIEIGDPDDVIEPLPIFVSRRP